MSCSRCRLQARYSFYGAAAGAVASSSALTPRALNSQLAAFWYALARGATLSAAAAAAAAVATDHATVFSDALVSVGVADEHAGGSGRAVSLERGAFVGPWCVSRTPAVHALRSLPAHLLAARRCVARCRSLSRGVRAARTHACLRVQTARREHNCV